MLTLGIRDIVLPSNSTAGRPTPRVGRGNLRQFPIRSFGLVFCRGEGLQLSPFQSIEDAQHSNGPARKRREPKTRFGLRSISDKDLVAVYTDAALYG